MASSLLHVLLRFNVLPDVDAPLSPVNSEIRLDEHIQK